MRHEIKFVLARSYRQETWLDVWVAEDSPIVATSPYSFRGSVHPWHVGEPLSPVGHGRRLFVRSIDYSTGSLVAFEIE